MASRIVIDPITRIEGHLRIEIAVQDGVVTDAFSSGTMVRGFELILKGRDPRDAWAFVERACGVCTTVHALASVRAVEDALGITVPPNADLIRNLMFCAQYLQDHVVHFYHLHALDWVDVVSALSADPKKTSEVAQSLSNWPKSSPGYFSDLQKRLKTFVDSGQLGIFANAYWGHSAYKLPAEVNLIGVAHYLEALEWQKEIVKVHAIFGGKNPHPNYLVGGVPCSLNIDEANSINAERLAHVAKLFDDAQQFVEQVYIPDLLAIASFYKGWLYGGGLSSQAVLSYGDIPQRANDYSPGNLLLPRGAIIGGKLDKVHEVDLKDPEQIQEFVNHSWYKYADESKGLHPFDGVTEPNYKPEGPNFKGTRTRIENLDESAKYSWIKAPRWRGNAMEVGCLSRMLLGYVQPKQYPFIKDTIDAVLKKLDVPVTALFSTLGRTAARGIETLYCADLQVQQFDKLIAAIKAGDTATANVEKWDPATWPKEAKGAGFTEAPRGALGHWIKIKDTKIDNYQCVVPTTWNGSPRDAKNQIGAYEASLMNTPLAKADEPLEILRTLHSFDPCLACSTHVMSPDGQEMTSVKVR